MKEKRTLFDYFKLPRRKTKVEDVSLSDNLVGYNTNECSPGYSDPVEDKKIMEKENKEGGYGEEIQNDLRSPFVDCELNEDGSVNPVNTSEDEANRTAKSGMEDRYGFLLDVRDKNGRRKGTEGYDASSLFIPLCEYQKLTPFEKQFWDIKKDHYDTVVLFKKGKFYELYEDDALLGARLFDFRVTERVNMKMSGFPESSVGHWTKKFLEHGYKVARVEQSENMIGKQMREKDERNGGNKAPRDKIIHRELKEIITQGTIYNSEYLSSAMPVFIMAATADEMCYSDVCDGKVHISVVLYDASVGEIYFSSFCDDEERHRIKTILSQHDVKEVICDFPIEGVARMVPDRTPSVSDKKYEFSNEREYLCFIYLLNYMRSLRRLDALSNVRVMELPNSRRFMVLDDITLRNMEVFRNSYDRTDEKTLFKAINLCNTPFGQRLLRRWVMAPLMNIEEIENRQRLSRMYEDVDTTSVRRSISSIGDAERMLARLHNGNPTVKDLNNFVRCIEACRRTLDILHSTLRDDEQLNRRFREYSLRIGEVLEWYCKTYKISEDGVTPGEDDGDELCSLLRDKEAVDSELNAYLQEQKVRLGCSSLRFRDVGKEIFQLEVPKGLSPPSDYIITSSTKTTNRFYSVALKRLVSKYVECEERLFQSKGSLLRRAVEALYPHTVMFHQVFDEIAHADCYLSFATFAAHGGKSTPIFSPRLCLSSVSNPIYPDFIPNDYVADKKVLVLTGPNMGGKSTLLRTICLNIILSQIGMKVCCERMETPVFDRIFTRIGASDNLVRGESTFMVELSETANILRNSTEDSFITIDELGRGTSTRDGECIARAVLEYLRTKKSHVVFSTHYHKLAHVDGVANGYMDSIVRGKEIVFLYKLVSGMSLNSHGLYVARMAGVPNSIVDRAEEVKNTLLNS